MKLRAAKKRIHALTRMEALIIIIVLAVLAIIFLPPSMSGDGGRIAQKISCVNNLKQVGLSFLIWAGDHSDNFPMAVSITNGGAMEWINTPDAWKTFQVMSNELTTPILLHCPGDLALPDPATNFTEDLKSKISYFIGASTSNSSSASPLSGDDNFSQNHSPVKPGLLTVTSPAELEWNGDRHTTRPGWFSFTKRTGGGNILLTDGSVQSVTTTGLKNLLYQTGLATNRLVIP